jgi:hypothetical protein
MFNRFHSVALTAAFGASAGLILLAMSATAHGQTPPNPTSSVGAAASNNSSSGRPPKAPGGTPADVSDDPELSPPPGRTVEHKNKTLAWMVPPLPSGMPAPSPDPHNFEGGWVHDQTLPYRIQQDIYGNPTPYTHRAHTLIAHRSAAARAGKPYATTAARCRPPGVVIQQKINLPFLVLQTKSQMEFLFLDYHGRETVYLDPAKAPPADHTAYMGVSVGHWDGDTLVVVTKGMKIPLWLDGSGSPVSTDGAITQRIRKVYQGHSLLEIVTTVDDPIYYTHPLSWMQTFAWRPDMDLLGEYDCETQAGDKSVSQDAGLAIEPANDDQ